VYRQLGQARRCRLIQGCPGAGRSRHDGQGAYEGQTAGVLDIYIVHQRQSYFLEMKAKRGSLSPEQIDMTARLEGAGAVCAVAKGLDAAIRRLEAWRLLVPVAEVLAANRQMAA
jgi:hypothetical protein